MAKNVKIAFRDPIPNHSYIDVKSVLWTSTWYIVVDSLGTTTRYPASAIEWVKETIVV
jgi:hypothetical protein